MLSMSKYKITWSTQQNFAVDISVVYVNQFMTYYSGATRGHMSPIANLRKPAIVIVTSFSLWHLAPTALAALAALLLIMTSFSLWRLSRLRRSQPTFSTSHYDFIRIKTSFAIELATPTVTDVGTYVTYARTDTLPITALNIKMPHMRP